jgi:hypothetical protein
MQKVHRDGNAGLVRKLQQPDCSLPYFTDGHPDEIDLNEAEASAEKW